MSNSNLDLFLTAMQGHCAAALLFLLLLLSAGFGVGGMVLSYRDFPLKNTVRLILGLNLLALIFRFIGIIPSWVTLTGLTAIAVVGLRWWPWRGNWCWRGAFALVGLVTLGSALCLPYAWDEQVYQVALLTRYLQQGSMTAFADNPYSAFPSMPHFLMLPGVQFSGVIFPRLLVWSTYLILLGGLFGLLRRFGRWNALVLVCAIGLSPLLMAMNRECYMEVFVAMNLLAAAGLLPELRRNPERTTCWFGLLAGMAASVKLTGGGAALAIAALCGWELWRQRRRVIYWRFFVVAALVMLIFYWRAFETFGNFLYPFGSSLAAPDSAAAMVEAYHSKLGLHLYGLNNVTGYLFGWFFAAYYENLYDGIVFGLQSLVMLGVTIFVLRKFYRSWRLFGGMVLAMFLMYLFWCASSQQTRFLMPIYGFLAWFCAAGLAYCRKSHRKKLYWGILGVLIGASLWSVNSYMTIHYYYAWKFLSQSQKEGSAFLGMAARDRAQVNVLSAIARRTEPESRIMLLFERRGLFVPRDYILATPYFQEKYFTPVPESADQVREVIEREKIDYIFVGASLRNPDYLEEYDPYNMKLTLHLRTLLRSGKLKLMEVPDSEDYTVLKVNP